MEDDTLERLHAAALAGEIDAMTNLGLIAHRQGSTSDARDWWLKAARYGDLAAMNNLGLLQLDATGGAEGYLWLLRAADGGYLPSMRTVGFWFLENDFLGRAEMWFEKGASLGDIESTYRLAAVYRQLGLSFQYWNESPFEPGKFWLSHSDTIFENLTTRGLDSAELLERALEWPAEDYTESVIARADETAMMAGSEAGDTEAMNRLGYLAHGGNDTAGAISYWKRAAENGHASAMSNLGFLYEAEGNLEEASLWWLAAIEACCFVPVDPLSKFYMDQGKAVEAVQLGELLLGSQWFYYEPVLARGDVEGAEELFRFASIQGNADGTCYLGLLALEKENSIEAQDFFILGANRGHSRSMVELGAQWFDGLLDEWEAEKWFKKAADLGDADGLHYLVKLYESGGCPESAVAADVSWWVAQADAGLEEARRHLDNLAGNVYGV
jgi:TPR repeat protein